MRIAVTGAAGLIGAHVTRAAIAAGCEVTALIRATSALDALAGLDVPQVAADILGPIDPLVAAFDGADVVIHAAATFAYGKRAEAIHRLAVDGSANVLRAAAEAGVARVVITSSSVVFGYSSDGRIIDEAEGLADPAGQPAYVAAKIAQDRAVGEQAEALGIALIRACPTMSVGPIATTLGPSNGLIVAYLADPLRCTFAGGCNIVSAEDVGAAHVLLARAGIPGRHYLLGSENLEWAQIHAIVGSLTGVGGPRAEIGAGLARTLAWAEEMRARLAHEPALATGEQAGMIGRYYWYDHSAAAALGYAPRPAAQALLEAVSWLVASRHVSREARAGIRLSDIVHRHREARLRGAAA